MERERLGSRLGFILLSAGCAIGIGNVWKFPYIAGQYGGGIFVLIYLFFLLILAPCLINIAFATSVDVRLFPSQNNCALVAQQKYSLAYSNGSLILLNLVNSVITSALSGIAGR